MNSPSSTVSPFTCTVPPCKLIVPVWSAVGLEPVQLIVDAAVHCVTAALLSHCFVFRISQLRFDCSYKLQ
jgi:hypothetical protein